MNYIKCIAMYRDLYTLLERGENMKLIVNADDFGYSRGANYGIVDAFKNGVIRSTTIMAGMPGYEHAVELLKDCNGLGCGVHLTLSAYKPLLDSHKTIVDESGYFYKKITPEVAINIDIEEVYNEFCAQIEKVKASGIDITHLDSHHHVHTFEMLKPVMERIVEKYPYPIRGGIGYKLDYEKIMPYEGIFYEDTVSIDSFKNLKEKSADYDVLETMSHPAYLDSFILENSSYNLKRIEELEILTSKELKNFLEENNIEVCNYRDIFK